MPKLENWKAVSYDDGDFTLIWGNIYDDEKGRFRDGAYIHTSKVLSSTETGVQTLNTYYTLGKKAEDRPVENFEWPSTERVAMTEDWP